jgi:hypothetical protein
MMASMRGRSVALAVVILLGATACGSDDDAADTANTADAADTGGSTTVATTTTAAGPLVFESRRHGFRVEVPEGWRTEEYEGEWTRLDQFEAGAEVPGEDVIATTDFSTYLVVNSMPIPAGMTPAEWEDAFVARVLDGLPATCDPVRATETFAGLQATSLTTTCEIEAVGRSFVHDGRGYYVTSGTPLDGAPPDGLDDLVRSFELVDG